MILGLLFGFIALIVIFSVIYAFLEQRYRIDLLESNDTDRLKTLGVEQLELIRQLCTSWPGQVHTRRRIQKISIDSSPRPNTGFLHTTEDQLQVDAIKNGLRHTVFICPFSPQNRASLEQIVQHFNNPQQSV